MKEELKILPERLQGLLLAEGYLHHRPEEAEFLQGMTCFGRVRRYSRIVNDRVVDERILDLLSEISIDPDTFSGWDMSFTYANRETGIKNFAKYKQPNPSNVDWDAYNFSVSYTWDDEARYIADLPLWDAREAFHALNMKASAGYPYNRVASKTEDVINILGEGFILDGFEEYASRDVIEFGSSSQKSEGRLETKLLAGGVRNFLAMPKRMCYVGNRLFGAQREAYVQHFRQLQHTAGDSKFHAGWDNMYHRMLSSRKGDHPLAFWFDLDVSKMDAKMYAIVKQDLLEFEWRMLPPDIRNDPKYRRVFNTYARNSIFSLVVLESGTVVMLNGGNKSGEDGTIYFNIRWLKILLRYCWFILTGEPFEVMDSHVNFQVLGDDGLFGVTGEYVHLYNYSSVREVIFSHWNIELESLTAIPRPLKDCIFLGHTSINFNGVWVPYPNSNKIMVVWLKGLKKKYKESDYMSLIRTNAVLIEVWWRDEFRRVVLSVRDKIHRGHLHDNSEEWRIARSTSFSSYEIEALYLKGYESVLQAVAFINQLHKDFSGRYILGTSMKKVTCKTKQALNYACADPSKVSNGPNGSYSAFLTDKQVDALKASDHASSIIRVKSIKSSAGKQGAVVRSIASAALRGPSPSLVRGLGVLPPVQEIADVVNRVDLRKEFKADRAAARGEKKSKFRKVLDDIIGVAGTIAPFLPLFLAAKHAGTQQKLAAAGIDLVKEGVVNANGVPFAQHVDLGSKVGLLDMRTTSKGGKVQSLRIMAFDEIGQFAPAADLDRGDVAFEAAIAPQVGVFANTRVAKLAGCWEKYRVNHCSLIYDSSCAADTSGSLGGYGDRDPEDRPFDDGDRAIKRAAAHLGYDQCTLYQAGHFELPRQKGNAWLFMDAHGSDARLTEAGVFALYATSDIAAAGTPPAVPSYGTFYCLYDIEFMLPQLDDDVIGYGAFAKGTGVPATPSLGAPLNMWGISDPSAWRLPGSTFQPLAYDRGSAIVGRWGWYGFGQGRWHCLIDITGTTLTAAYSTSSLAGGKVSTPAVAKGVINGAGTEGLVLFSFDVTGRCSSPTDGYATFNISATGSVTGITWNFYQVPDSVGLDRRLTLQDYEEKVLTLEKDLSELRKFLRPVSGNDEPRSILLSAEKHREKDKQKEDSLKIEQNGDDDSVVIEQSKLLKLQSCAFCGDPAPNHVGSNCPKRDRRAIARPK